MPKTRILIVDDEAGMLEVCADTLRQLPEVEILALTESTRAVACLESERPDLLITDLSMPGLSGVELLRQARQRDPHLSVLVLTAYPCVETAVECMKLGAADYLTKPFLPEDLLATVRRLLEGKRLQEENDLLRRQLGRTSAFGELLGKSGAMQAVFESIARAAATDFDVLIAGETGTGKELVARALHQRSRRQAGPFVPVDCGAIPEELMESEFFGHERGAFTGAQTRGLGLMEFAKGGTFFMDEIAQMPRRLQAKLLRVLQERRIRRVGGTEEIAIDVRMVVASSVNLHEAVQRERFRPDLYHRVNVVRIALPPLRERVEDIPILVQAFVERYAKELERGPWEVAPEALEVLTAYAWPGNVRELQNVIKRTLAMAGQSRISVEDLPDDLLAAAGPGPAKRANGFAGLRERKVAEFEKEYLRSLLERWRGDVVAAAHEAGLPRATLYRLLKRRAVEPAGFRATTPAVD